MSYPYRISIPLAFAAVLFSFTPSGRALFGVSDPNFFEAFLHGFIVLSYLSLPYFVVSLMLDMWHGLLDVLEAEEEEITIEG